VARALLVGCGCAAGEAGELLLGRGWSVRGTSRRAERLTAIEARGIEAVRADPDRLGTIVERLGDVTVLAWLFGSAAGSPAELAALHSERLESLLEKLVDSPVRGFVYEGAGSADPDLLAAGGALVCAAEARWRIPTRVTARARGDGYPAWARELAGAVERVVGLG
jgi:hypothetical protein